MVLEIGFPPPNYLNFTVMGIYCQALVYIIVIREAWKTYNILPVGNSLEYAKSI